MAGSSPDMELRKIKRARGVGLRHSNQPSVNQRLWQLRDSQHAPLMIRLKELVSPSTEVRQPVRTKVVVKVVERHIERIVYVNVPCPAQSPTNGHVGCPTQHETVFVSTVEFRNCQALTKIDCQADHPAKCVWWPSFETDTGKRTRAQCIPISLNNLIKDENTQ
jgi:hypothetical protein